MQSVTAIICRKRDATVGDTGKGEGGGKEKKWGRKKKAIIRRREGKERGMA